MIIGLSLTPFGHDPDAWREEPLSNHLGFDAFMKKAQEAEDAGVDFLLLADEFAAPPRNALSPVATPFDPALLIAAMATKVRRIGFLAAQATAQHAPYHLARRFASLDLMSAGRTGWLAVAQPDAPERDEEYLVVVEGLWDSWEDETFIYDKAEGRFFRSEKMHVLNHKGRHFSVRGPLNVNRSPQGTPVVAILADGASSPAGIAHADVVLVAGGSVDAIKSVSHAVRETLAVKGRSRNDVRLMALVAPFASESHPGIPVLPVDGTEAEVATALAGLITGAELDGIVALPSTNLAAARFLAKIVPLLGRREAREPATLRERLGLPRPIHPAARTGKSR